MSVTAESWGSLELMNILNKREQMLLFKNEYSNVLFLELKNDVLFLNKQMGVSPDFSTECYLLLDMYCTDKVFVVVFADKKSL